ncbi:acetolactate decarboxylase [Aquimarina brevivitae]|uniref:Acetolactate decarboxylase n=1 Tax=Aquimarina brevivitae TaxID=323412 RepID=A0A4Q7PJL5_9FLAO|nr:acetolactate decarboxylase [Aquimarina brevivitae]RZT00249.1 acetolactate decarboxylase [Aquimarina brevivitae]
MYILKTDRTNNTQYQLKLNSKYIYIGLLMVGFIGCHSIQKNNNATTADSYPDIAIVGAMKNVMWKGELGGVINLDTIANKNGLYGLGPLSYLKGELLINNGKSYVSRVTSDSTMTVEKSDMVSAPFFVYGNVTEWHKIDLPAEVNTIKAVTQFIDDNTSAYEKPFAFKIIGKVSTAQIHIQNLPEGMTVSSPTEAHQGQTNYVINDEDVEIIGFFSKEHQGIFTHHDAWLHMHLITKDESKMGHVDTLFPAGMTLYLPKK